MKIKTNVHAGAGGGNAGGVNAGGVGGGGAGGHSSQANNTVVFYVAAVSRCVGI